MIQDVVFYGKNRIVYTIKYTNRKSLKFKVYEDGMIVAYAPKNTPLNTIANEAKLKSEWMFRQLFFQMLLNPVPDVAYFPNM